MTHTPGPWTRDGWANQSIFAPDGHVVATIHQKRAKDNSSTKANARLIAAAPDMLARLEEAVAYLKDDTEQRPGPVMAGADQRSLLLTNIESVISKATQA